MSPPAPETLCASWPLWTASVTLLPAVSSHVQPMRNFLRSSSSSNTWSVMPVRDRAGRGYTLCRSSTILLRRRCGGPRAEWAEYAVSWVQVSLEISLWSFYFLTCKMKIIRKQPTSQGCHEDYLTAQVQQLTWSWPVQKPPSTVLRVGSCGKLQVMLATQSLC